MKFINYLESIVGIEIYPLISLSIFFIFFSLLIVFVVKANKNYISEMENIPLDKNL